MGTISFNNQDVSFLLKDKLLLKTFLASIFAREGHDFKSVSYIFCSDSFLLALNKKFLNHDTYTDILTFTLSETSLPTISEIYISIERVEENAMMAKTSFQNELLRVMIHGILHLCGYEDYTPSLKKKIHEKEDFYLSQY